MKLEFNLFSDKSARILLIFLAFARISIVFQIYYFGGGGGGAVANCPPVSYPYVKNSNCLWQRRL
jgi:hypothetical protein